MSRKGVLLSVAVLLTAGCSMTLFKKDPMVEVVQAIVKLPPPEPIPTPTPSPDRLPTPTPTPTPLEKLFFDEPFDAPVKKIATKGRK